METLRATSPLRVGGVTLVPIERIAIHSGKGGTGYWIGGIKAAFAVVVCDTDGIKAFTVDASEIALDALMEETPNLAAILSQLPVARSGSPD